MFGNVVSTDHHRHHPQLWIQPRFLASSMPQIVSSSEGDRTARTINWLQKQEAWTAHDVSYARNLVNEWIDDQKPLSVRWSTRILQRWLREIPQSQVTNEGLLDGLHRILHAARNSGDEHDGCLRLLQNVVETSQKTNDPMLLPGNKAYSMLFKLLAQRPDTPGTFDLAEQLMNQRLETNDLIPVDIHVWNSYLAVLAKCSPYEYNAPERAEQVVREVMTCEVDAHSWGRVLHAWAKSGRPEAAARAQVILDLLLKEENMANTVMFNTCIDAWGQAGKGEEAEQLLQRMLSQGEEGSTTNMIKPDSYSFLGAMNAWSKSGAQDAPERAEKLLEQMEHLYESGRVELRPSTEVYTCLLGTWAQRPDCGAMVESLLRKMEERYERSGNDDDRPSLVTYAAAIRAWGNTTTFDAPERALAIVQQLEELDPQASSPLAPDTFTYTNMIHAWSASDRADAPKRALSILRGMEQLSNEGRRGVKPSTITYNAVIHAFARHGETEIPERLLEAMEDQHSSTGAPPPDFVTYATVIRAWEISRSPKAAARARELLEAMQERADLGNAAWMPSSAVYASVIRAQGNTPGENGAESAEDVMRKIHERSLSGKSPAVEPAICNEVIRVWCRSREGVAPDRAERILRWMTDHGVQPNEQTFNAVVRTWKLSKRRIAPQRIEALQQLMLATDL